MLTIQFAQIQIRDVYRRATTHHLPDKLDIHLKYAGFEERRGEFGRAAEILRDLEQKHHPEMLNLMLRRYSPIRLMDHRITVQSGYGFRS